MQELTYPSFLALRRTFPPLAFSPHPNPKNPAKKKDVGQMLSDGESTTPISH
jgi:hypothetical protein